MDQSKLIGKRVAVYQSPGYLEGIATVTESTDVNPILEDRSDGIEKWSCCLMVRFEGESESYMRWVNVWSDMAGIIMKDQPGEAL